MKKTIIFAFGTLTIITGGIFLYFKNKKTKKPTIQEIQLTKINNEILHSQVSPYDDEKMWF